MREWRNRQTRTFEGRVGQLVRVQVPSLAPDQIERSGFFIPLKPARLALRLAVPKAHYGLERLFALTAAPFRPPFITHRVRSGSKHLRGVWGSSYGFKSRLSHQTRSKDLVFCFIKPRYENSKGLEVGAVVNDSPVDCQSRE